MSDQQEVLNVARGLTGAVEGLSGRLDGVRKDSEDRDAALEKALRIVRRAVIGLVISFLVDVAVTGVVAHNTISLDRAQGGLAMATAQLSSTRASVKQLNAALIAGCQLNNTSKAEQVTLWTHIAALPRTYPPGTTKAQIAAQEKTTKDFLVYVHHTFMARNCVAAYHLPGK